MPASGWRGHHQILNILDSRQIQFQVQHMQTYLEKRDHQKNQARFYCMAVLPNLFGEWTLRREWGRIGTYGQVRLECFRSMAEAEDALLAMENRKRQRGYFMEPQQLPML